MSGHELYQLARRMTNDGRRGDIHAETAAIPDTLTLRLCPEMRKDGYRLSVHKDGIILEAQSPAAAFYGWQTLRQIIQQAAGM